MLLASLLFQTPISPSVVSWGALATMRVGVQLTISRSLVPSERARDFAEAASVDRQLGTWLAPPAGYPVDLGATRMRYPLLVRPFRDTPT